MPCGTVKAEIQLISKVALWSSPIMVTSIRTSRLGFWTIFGRHGPLLDPGGSLCPYYSRFTPSSDPRRRICPSESFICRTTDKDLAWVREACRGNLSSSHSSVYQSSTLISHPNSKWWQYVNWGLRGVRSSSKLRSIFPYLSVERLS